MVEVMETGIDWLDRSSGDENTVPRHHAIRIAWQQLIEDAQLQYRYVSYLDVESGREDLSGFKMLILLETAALSDAEAGVVREFVLSSDVCPVDHVVRLDVYAPDDTWCHWYSGNCVAVKGRAAFTIPFALSDAPGRWRLAVRDVVTGIAAEKTVTLSGPGYSTGMRTKRA